MSIAPDGRVMIIEVKGRVLGGDEVIITKTEILTGKNKGENHILAVVSVHPDGPELDEVRYLSNFFADAPDLDFRVTKQAYAWPPLWAMGTPVAPVR